MFLNLYSHRHKRQEDIKTGCKQEEKKEIQAISQRPSSSVGFYFHIIISLL